MHKRTNAQTHARAHARTRTRALARAHARKRENAKARKCASAHARARTHIHTACTPTHTHTHTHARRQAGRQAGMHVHVCALAFGSTIENHHQQQQLLLLLRLLLLLLLLVLLLVRIWLLPCRLRQATQAATPPLAAVTKLEAWRAAVQSLALARGGTAKMHLLRFSQLPSVATWMMRNPSKPSEKARHMLACHTFCTL